MQQSEIGWKKVVVLDRFRSGRSLSPLRQAEAYWLALCGETGVPRRSQIDPRALGNILEHSFILERVSRRAARFRLAGDHLTALAGMDLRGTPFTALFADEARAEAGAILQRVFTAPAVAELRLQTSLSARAPALEARMLLLPLATEDGDVARALGVLVADTTLRAPPVRFDIANRLLRPVATAPQAPAQAPVQTEDPGQAEDPPKPLALTISPASRSTDGFAEARTALEGQPPHLRLIK
ncbi:PAS domain-containing protein [Antarcticimicrobium sediminis]|uniref:PAS domain-containing protein n=2 Tax=Antarcticimicrobium sediminis TaxID=2546227 RepID=A0A4R5EUL3_9RHOB|nr:PAS domain-containing protein [Antarcticimicrobium sediminis]